MTLDVKSALAHLLIRNPNAHWVDVPKTIRDYRPRGSTAKLSIVRLIYPLLVGALPEDKSLERFCDHPRCVNPHHYMISKRTNPGLARKKRSQDRDRRMDTSWATSTFGMIEGAIEALHLLDPDHPCDGPAIIRTLAECGVPITPEDVIAYYKEFPPSN